jgi:hypothetical protein
MLELVDLLLVYWSRRTGGGEESEYVLFLVPGMVFSLFGRSVVGPLSDAFDAALRNSLRQSGTDSTCCLRSSTVDSDCLLFWICKSTIDLVEQ